MQNNNQERTDAHERLQRLRTSARILQTEIDKITREIQQLDTSLRNENTQKTEQTNNATAGSIENKRNANPRNKRENEQDTPLQVGLKIQYNRKGGKRLNTRNKRNGHGTITKITDQWVYFKTDEGEIKYRAPKNVAQL